MPRRQRVSPREGPSSGGNGEVSGAGLSQLVRARADAVNRALANLDARLRFLVEEADEVRILVIEGETGRLIRKIPPDYFLRATEGLSESPGLLFDEGL